MKKTWQIKKTISSTFFEQFPELNPVTLQLLINREIDTQEKVDKFLSPNYSRDIYDPFLFKDMNRVVDRIMSAIENNENIAVHGDYDADGVTGSAVLMKTLSFLGAKNLKIFIPHREKEGYGLNTKTVQYLKSEKCSLIITTDCGISSLEQVELANSLNIDVIITDHHNIPAKLPPALAIINPKISNSGYPFDQLAGVGIAFKVSQALLQKSTIDQQKKEAFEKWLLDMVAIGTIADCSVIADENRVLVKYGLIVLNKTTNLGLIKLLQKIGYDASKNKLDTFHIGFQIAPRINAAGRMDHANAAFELLMSDNEQEAESLSLALNDSNQERQKQTEYIFQEAKKQAMEQKDDYVIIVVNPEWSVGIVGLVAGKLVNELGKPALVIGGKNGQLSGSARSIPQFNIMEHLNKLAHLFTHFGGHSQAAGFTLLDDKLENFKQQLSELAKIKLQNIDLSPALNIDAEIKLADVNWGLFEDLEKFEPFGEGNTEPLFLIKQVQVVEVRGVGQDEKHLKLKVQDGNKAVPVIGFCFGNTDDGTENWCAKLNIGDKVDIVVNIGVNEWNGNRELQLKLVDIKKDF